ncbi:regulatory protein RecX [Catenovulum sp. SM1970]|uniref:regulatory protein RecX n=1 Tax=Marinifaba aquimaris TaxID=2741323 RepID=UPI0015718757|nr:regulatory protein RecX [Marinifaba aquimaris]NTS78100.1 regulatory protein RecX [Marinifaba aquimaris]
MSIPTSPSEQWTEQTKQGTKFLYDWLSRREHSCLELQKKLAEKGIDKAIHKTLIEHFIAQGYQSDRRYMEMIIRAKANKGYGPNHIKQLLKQQQVDISDFNALVLENEINWFDIGYRTFCKKFGEQVSNDFKTKQKQQAYMIKKGFSFDCIKSIWSELS